MGGERRETEFEFPDNARNLDSSQMQLEVGELVWEWIETQIGWGWAGGGWEIDFTFMEGSDGVGTVIVSEEAVPNTRVAQRQPAYRPSLEEWIERYIRRPGTTGDGEDPPK